MDTLVFIGIGLGAGVLAGIFGLGGGIVIVPALTLLARFAPQTATGTSLASLLLPVGALGAWAYYKEGHVRIGAALWIAIGLAIGAYFGARMAMSVPPQTLKRAFAVFLVLIAARLWFEK